MWKYSSKRVCGIERGGIVVIVNFHGRVHGHCGCGGQGGYNPYHNT